MSVLKAKINEAVGLPAGKQKLQYEVKIVSTIFVIVDFIDFWHRSLMAQWVKYWPAALAVLG